MSSNRSVVVHEIRSQLTLISACAKQISHTPLPAGSEPTRIAERLERSVTVLDALVVSLGEGDVWLDHFPDLVAECDPLSLMRGAATQYAQIAQRAGVEIRLSGEERKHAPFSCEPTVALLVFGNLIQNAIKHGGGGTRITLSVEERGPLLAFVVEDDGLGIDGEEVERLFVAGVRGNAARRAGVPGSGLGLALCRRFARRLGGTVEHVATSKGTCFEVILPRDARAVRASVSTHAVAATKQSVVGARTTLTLRPGASAGPRGAAAEPRTRTRGRRPNWRRLTESEWRALVPLFPARRKARVVGRPRTDDRACFEGILWVLWTGAPWRDIPRTFAPATTCWKRYREWESTGLLGNALRMFVSNLREKERAAWRAILPPEAGGTAASARQAPQEPVERNEAGHDGEE